MPEESLHPSEPTLPVNTGNNTRASWPFSLHNLRSNIAHYDSEAKELLVATFLWCTDDAHPVHREELARRVGYDASTIYKVFAGKYKGAGGELLGVPVKLAKALSSFLKLEKQRSIGGKSEFVLTPTAQRVFNACDLARESNSPVWLWGPSHCGKTTAGLYYKDHNNHGRTAYARLNAISGLGGMVRTVAHSIGISDSGNTAQLVEYIIRAVTKDMVLILDEMHELTYTYRKESFFACVETIRQIYDATHCGMVFMGTKLLMDKVKGAKHAELEQVMKRGVHRINLNGAPTPDDVSIILNHYGLEMPDRKFEVQVQGIVEQPYEILRKLAKHEGLKSITERIRYGRKFAARKKAPLTWHDVVDAHLTIEREAIEIKDEEFWK